MSIDCPAEDFANFRRCWTGRSPGCSAAVHLLPFYLSDRRSRRRLRSDRSHASRSAPRFLGRRARARRRQGTHGRLDRQSHLQPVAAVRRLFRERARFAYDGLFLTFDGVFPKGATESELLQIYRLRPGLPFTAMKFGNGDERLLWTTFTSGQIDIDVSIPRASAIWSKS